MKKLSLSIAGCALFASLSYGQVFINEILLNPPGADSPNEYFELRGPANLPLAGYYLIGVEGDLGTPNPGDIQDIFDLGTFSLGANGFFLALQKNHVYSGFGAGATVITNGGSGTGWGNGATSSMGHSADGTQTDLENASATYMLVNALANPPTLTLDLDTDNNGLDTLPVGWTVFDSVGVMDDTAAAGDRAYGALTFRNSSGASVGSGNIVELTFTAGYLGRKGASTGSTSGDWVAADILGTAPDFSFSTSVSDNVFANFSLTPTMVLGGPNAVPEPGTYAMIAMGLGLLLLIQKKIASR